MSKPNGMLDTEHLIQLQEEPLEPTWGLLGDLYGYNPAMKCKRCDNDQFCEELDFCPSCGVGK